LNTNFRIRSTLAAILLFVGLLSAGYAQADSANITSVSLDPTFSDDGWTTLDFFGRSDIVDSVLIQPDGRLILSGQVAVNTTSRDFGLARYNPDGTLDDTFGTGGMLNLDLGGREYTGVAVLQSDGKIVVGGEQSISGTDFIIARLNTDGSLDTTFGAPNGYVVTDLGGSDFDLRPCHLARWPHRCCWLILQLPDSDLAIRPLQSKWQPGHHLRRTQWLPGDRPA